MAALALPSFNPLTFANRLKSVGVPPEQAEAEAAELREAFEARDRALAALEQRFDTAQLLSQKEAEQLPTKGDVFTVQADVLKLNAKVDLVIKEVGALEQRLVARVDAQANHLVIKLTVVMVGLIGLAGAVLTLVTKLS